MKKKSNNENYILTYDCLTAPYYIKDGIKHYIKLQHIKHTC